MCLNSFSSRAARMEATAPSIIPDGARMSAPARAWLMAWSASFSQVASWSMIWLPWRSVSRPQWPWSVYSHKQTSVMQSRSGTADFKARRAFWIMPC